MMTMWDLKKKKKNVKLSKRNFKQTRFVVLIKLNNKCLKIPEPSNEPRRNLIKKASLFDVRKTWNV